MKKLLLIILMLIPVVSHAEFFKANQIKEHCFRDGKYHEGLCLGYIMGVHDGIQLMEESWHDVKYSICLPNKTKSGELKEVVSNMLENEDLDNMKDKASDIIWQALLQNFPCK